MDMGSCSLYIGKTTQKCSLKDPTYDDTLMLGSNARAISQKQPRVMPRPGNIIGSFL